MPKLPPPPRIAQKRSGFESADAVRTLPSALTTCGLDEVVAREAVLAPQPAVAAAEREPGDAGVRDHAARRDQPERLGLPVDVRPERAALHVRQASLGVDLHAAHRREVDQHAAVDRRQPGDRVAAAAHRHDQAVVAREVHRVDHVGRARAADHQRGLPVVHRVELGSDPGITRLRGGEGRTSQPGLKGLQRLVGDSGSGIR